MALPKYDEMYIPFLSALQDGQVRPLREIRASIARQMAIGEADLNELQTGRRQTVFQGRVGWTRAYLKAAGLVAAPRRAHLIITEEGKRVLDSGVVITNELLAERYPEFAAFVGGQPQGGAPIAEPSDAETPQEAMERAHQMIHAQLADDLLTEIVNQTPGFFEALVVDLMKAMGYGDGFVTRASGDGGIDGVIHEDRLGFNLIYIQAKKWAPDRVVGRPELQSFVGAMAGPPRINKGLFITTARFSQGAKEYAEAQHVILVDGKRLTDLMIEYGLGVSVESTYTIQRIDSDYFNDHE